MMKLINKLTCAAVFVYLCAPIFPRAQSNAPGPGGLGISLVTDGTTTVTGTRQMVFTGGGATVSSGGTGSGIVDVSIVGGITIGAPVTGCATPGYVLYNNTGIVGCENLAGGGNVLNSGTPTNGQLAQWTDATHVQGFTLGTNVATALGQTIGGTSGLVIGGANSNITSLTGLTTALSAPQGGLGAPSLTGLIIGHGASAATGLAEVDGQCAVGAAGAWTTGTCGSGGGVSSVGLALPSFITVSGSPVTTSGTLTGTLATQVANAIFAGPTTGSAAAPTFRSLVAADLPLATTSAFGAVKPDGTTITISGGVISSVGGSATSITPGTTTIGGATAPCVISNTSSTVMGCIAETGTGNIVLATSPTLVTPALGTPSSGTLTNATGLPATGVVNTALTASGTGQGLTGGFHPTAYSNGTVSSGTTTIDCGNGPLQTLTNGGAFTFAMSANDGNCTVRITNNGSAGTITFSGFSEGTNTGDALTTTNTNKFDIVISRIGGNPHYLVSALQ